MKCLKDFIIFVLFVGCLALALSAAFQEVKMKTCADLAKDKQDVLKCIGRE
jgi:hypothetical protein